MKRNKFFLGVAILFTLVAVIVWPQSAVADGGRVHTTFPSAEDPGPPFYTNIDVLPPHLFEQDGEWAAIVFYRDPGCVPSGFNLLDMFDFQNAFGCTLTIEGFHLWEGEPFAEGPRKLEAKGLGAVPVWFVPVDVIDQAIQDGVLTIGELAGLPGLLVGYADQFNLVLHPLGSSPNPLLIINAKGQLDNGRQFKLHATEGGNDPFEVKAIKIEFK